jgi:hypothetical protein
VEQLASTKGCSNEVGYQTKVSCRSGKILQLLCSAAKKHAASSAMSFVDQMERHYGAKVVVFLAHETPRAVWCSGSVKSIHTMTGLLLILDLDLGLRQTPSPPNRFKRCMEPDMMEL